MRRMLMWSCGWLSVLLLLICGCGGQGGMMERMGRLLTPYAMPARTGAPRAAGEPTRVIGATRVPTAQSEANAKNPTAASRAFDYGLIDADPTTNVELAHEALSSEGLKFRVVIVSETSTGIEGLVYRDLSKRELRATTGADEGIDTSEVSCHPNCVFVRQEAVNEIGVESWKNVLRHEQRHMVQAGNNPNMAREFRPLPDGLFTSYAAFLEACADDGIFVAEQIYHASERMARLRFVLGEGIATPSGGNAAATRSGTMDVPYERACRGFKEAYGSVVKSYELKAGEGSFGELFPPYR